MSTGNPDQKVYVYAGSSKPCEKGSFPGFSHRGHRARKVYVYVVFSSGSLQCEGFAHSVPRFVVLQGLEAVTARIPTPCAEALFSASPINVDMVKHHPLLLRVLHLRSCPPTTGVLHGELLKLLRVLPKVPGKIWSAPRSAPESALPDFPGTLGSTPDTSWESPKKHSESTRRSTFGDSPTRGVVSNSEFMLEKKMLGIPCVYSRKGA